MRSFFMLGFIKINLVTRLQHWWHLYCVAHLYFQIHKQQLSTQGAAYGDSIYPLLFFRIPIVEA